MPPLSGSRWGLTYVPRGHRYDKGRMRSYKPKAPWGGARANLGNALAIAQLNKRIGGFSGLELKFFDTSLVATAISAVAAYTGAEMDPATVLCLNAMTTGTGPNARLGRHIQMKSIQIKLQVKRISAESDTGPQPDVYVYVALVLDKQTNKAQLSSEQVFTNVPANTTLNAQPFINMENTDRFRVLKHKMLKMSVTTAQQNEGAVNLFANGALVKNFTWNCNLRNMKVLFDGVDDPATIANIQDKSLHIVAFATQATNCQLSYQSRLRFTTS